jgi:uncharacterized protein YbjQ (UPF0145 family)
MTMNTFHLIFATVVALSLLSGGAAVILALAGSNGNAERRHAIERLSQIAQMGASAIVAILTKFSEG